MFGNNLDEEIRKTKEQYAVEKVEGELLPHPPCPPSTTLTRF